MKTNKPLKILFDANPMVSGQKSGVGYYTFQLIEALSKNYPDDIELVGHYFNFLGRKTPVLPRSKNIQYKTSKFLPGKTLAILRRFSLQLPFDLLIKTKGDVALFPNYVCLPTIQRIKKVVAIHDLCFEDFPEYLQVPNQNFLKKFVPNSIGTADLVITISESTKKAIQKHYHTKSDKILITPIPPATPSHHSAPKPKGLSLPKKYILFVSTLEPRKNYINLARAYALLPHSIKEQYGLVLAGGIGWDSDVPMDEIKTIQESGDNIVVTGYISEDTRTYLYQNASLFVMPSHYEGFGMPILEAMTYGVPVAVSNIPVFHEVAGDAAVYFNKDNPDDIAGAITKVLNNKDLRIALENKASERLKQYDWTVVAREVMSSLKKLVE